MSRYSFSLEDCPVAGLRPRDRGLCWNLFGGVGEAEPINSVEISIYISVFTAEVYLGLRAIMSTDIISKKCYQCKQADSQPQIYGIGILARYVTCCRMSLRSFVQFPGFPIVRRVPP